MLMTTRPPQALTKYTYRYTYILVSRKDPRKMPLLIQVSRGLLTPEGERSIFKRVARALLEAHGLEENPFMKQNVIGHLAVSEEADSFVGESPASLAVIEVKVPSVTFQGRAVQEAFVARVTDIVDELKAGAHPRSRTFVNVTYAVDGTWGIAGKAYTNDDLGSAIAASMR
jgi:phenylpyruvate tautomerase PptA (4-oxalocrotonate tautomerase family)